MDGFQALLLIGFFIKQKQNPNWAIYKNPITVLIIVWIVYNLIQFVNPSAESRMAWLYTIRTVAVVMLMYFVFMYNITSLAFIKIILKLWLALSLFAAIYAFKQEHIGYFDFEARGLADEKVRSLLFIDGHWRKYAIFSDPVAFAYNMVASILLCVGLMLGPTARRQKIILGLMALFFITVMLYSGTRGAYVLLPAAFALYAVMHFNKKMLVLSIAGVVMMLVLISIPSSNPTLVRFQSAFKPSKDLSYLVRKKNQERIKPYIWTHPLGGGLGATGVWGQRFAPWSFLANFPPDSGYVRVAVELGWIGLFIFCSFMFVVLKKGIEHYYAIKDPWLKSISLTMLLIAFALNIANFPQEAFVQFPINIYFYLVIALINIVYRLDQEQESKRLNDGRVD
jgi:O-antigen ligase